MSDYDKSWGKFMEKLYKREEYYELTVDELKKLCIGFGYVLGGGHCGVREEWLETWLEEWLNKNIKDEA